MKLFITGATGFIGSHLIQQALTAGHQVLALRRPGSHPKIQLDEEPEWINGDLENFDVAATQNCDVMIHAAAHSANTPYDNLATCIYWNVCAAITAVMRVNSAGIKRFVFVGSCFEYGLTGNNCQAIPANAPLRPLGTYPTSKAMASLALLELARERKFTASVARLFHVYGEGEPSGRFWPSLVHAAKIGADFQMSDGNQVRDFLPVSSAASLLLAEAERMGKLTHYERSLINLGTGQGQRLVDFAAKEWKRLGATGQLRPGSYPRKADEIERLVPDLSRTLLTDQ